jgi:hypothetical protein
MASGAKGGRSKSLVKGKAAAREAEQESPKRGRSRVKKEVEIDAHSSEWDAPFDLAGFPTVLRGLLVAAAPCLLGREKAVYDAEFFRRVVGLYAEGLLPKEVTDIHVPPEVYEDEWVGGDGPNKTRFPLDRCSNKVTWDLFLMQYQRVYGDVPDNKAISLTFLRACCYYYQAKKKHKVNWAAQAAKVIADRRNHAGNNPQKLGPPALKDQMAGIVRECAKWIRQHSGGGGAIVAESGDIGVRKVEQLMKEITRRTGAVEEFGKALEELKTTSGKVEQTGRDLEAEDERLNELKDNLRKKNKQHAAAGELIEKAECDKQ